MKSLKQKKLKENMHLKYGQWLQQLQFASGVYVVEASWIVSISLLMIMATILLGFDVYEESIDFIQSASIKEVDVVSIFKIAGTVKN